jgi:hypothetical protein
MAIRFDEIEFSGANNHYYPVLKSSGHVLRSQSAYGYIDIGPGNASYAHITTDRPAFYFNAEIQVDSGHVRSYNEDLILSRAGDANRRIEIKSAETLIKMSDTDVCTISNASTNSTVLRLSATGDSTTLNFQTDHIYTGGTALHIGNTNGPIYLRDDQVTVNTTSPSSGYELTVNGDGDFYNTVRAQSFVDRDDSSYYVDPHNNSVIRDVKGFRHNLATGEDWGLDSNGGNLTGYFGGSFNGMDNTIYTDGPDGKRELVMETTPDSGNDYDGGWTKSLHRLNAQMPHLSVVYVRRVTTTTSGSFYHGTATSTGQIMNLSGSGNTNPYFHHFNIGSLPYNVWCVSIGIIQANNDTNTDSGKYTGANGYCGVYRCDTGQKIINSASAWKHQQTGTSVTLTSGHRTFLYYSTDNASKIQLARPGFYEMNGNEPTLAELKVNATYQLDTDRLTVTTGSVGLNSGDTGLFFDGNYTDGRYRHRWRKQDVGGGVPLYLDYSAGTANTYTNIVRFGIHTGNPYRFEVMEGAAAIKQQYLHAYGVYGYDDSNYYVDVNTNGGIGMQLQTDIRLGPGVATNHGSGRGWNTQIHIGSTSNSGTNNAFPTYIDGGYGIQVAKNSDGCFFGLVTRDSGSN